MLESIDRNSGKISEIVKIIFTVDKQVDFGRAVYVCGNLQSLGEWDLSSAFKLTWSQGHQWTGHIILNRKAHKQFEFKYVIADWKAPCNSHCEWEEGTHNRILTIETNRKLVACNHRWNMDKVTLILFVNQSLLSREYFVIGNTAELGLWKSTRQMKSVQLKEFPSDSFTQKKVVTRSRCETAFTYTFFTSRIPKNIHYHYINKNVEIEKQRNPSRVLNFSSPNTNKHPQRLHLTYTSGDIQIYETCQFNQLHVSQISKDIFLGAYPRTKEDFEKLKQMGVDAVLGIQTKEDYSSHGLSSYYLKMLCEEYGIRYHSYSIRDMSREEFVGKCLGAFLLLRKLIVEDHKKVYVHCSAGMYRSPQIIILYLARVQRCSLESAIDMVMDKHPFARPNYTLLLEALALIDLKMSKVMEQL